ncbi:MAG: hypothetical protein ABI193_22815 [Minicystis sp.]
MRGPYTHWAREHQESHAIRDPPPGERARFDVTLAPPMSTSPTHDLESVKRFLPTLESIRGGCPPLDPEGDPPALPDGEPTAQRRLAAIVIFARVIRRESREEDTEMSLARASYLLPDMPPAPRDFVEQSYLVRAGGGYEERACTGCDVRRPGFTTCHGCGGSAWLEAPGMRCPSCDGGFILCSTCDGIQRTVAVKLRFVNDVHVVLHDVFIPEAFRYLPALFSFPPLLRDLLEQVVPPLELASPLFAQTKSSAYRDAVRKDPDPVFHGHRFEDALTAARTALQSLVKPKSEIVLHDVRSYAWPFLWLEHGKGEAKRDSVYVVRPDGVLVGYAGKEA